MADDAKPSWLSRPAEPIVRWEYRMVHIGGRLDLVSMQMTTAGDEGWEAFAATDTRMWFKRKRANG